MLSRVFGFGRRSFDSLSEQEILALAISSEEDDGRIYRAYADGLAESFPQSAKVFEAMAEEISPVTGSLFAFRRADNSWHGHTSFVGERRVVQMTWLRSQADVDRKKSRGSLSHFFKKVLRFG